MTYFSDSTFYHGIFVIFLKYIAVKRAIFLETPRKRAIGSLSKDANFHDPKMPKFKIFIRKKSEEPFESFDSQDANNINFIQNKK